MCLAQDEIDDIEALKDQLLYNDNLASAIRMASVRKERNIVIQPNGTRVDMANQMLVDAISRATCTG